MVEGTGSRQRLCFQFRPIDLLCLMPRSPGTTGWSMSQSPTLKVWVRGTRRVHARGPGSCSCHQAQWRRQLILPTAMMRDSSVCDGRCRGDQLNQRSLSGRWHCGVHLRFHHFGRPVEEAPICHEERASLPQGSISKRSAIGIGGSGLEEVIRQERGWKLMLLLPRMLLHRPPGGGLIAKDKLHQRFQSFVRGDDEAAIARRRRRHRAMMCRRGRLEQS